MSLRPHIHVPGTIVVLLIAALSPSVAAETVPSDPSNPAVEIVVSYRSSALEEFREESILIELFPDHAPLTVQYFLELSRSGFYEGTQFHQIVADTFIQGGDDNTKDDNPLNDGDGEASNTVPVEVDSSLSHVQGAVGLARDPGQPAESGTQFYMLQSAMPERDGDYTVFGMIREGQEVVRAISNLDTLPTTDRPVFPATIVQVVVFQGEAAEVPEEDDGPPVLLLTLSTVAVVLVAAYFIRRTIRQLPS